MDISVKEPGWEPFEWEDIKVKIKILTSDEGLDLRNDLTILDSISVFDPKVKGYFKKYAKDIEGLSINGQKVDQPENLLDPSIGRSTEIERFYIAVIEQFFVLNTVSEDERKNSDSPLGG